MLDQLAAALQALSVRLESQQLHLTELCSLGVTLDGTAGAVRRAANTRGASNAEALRRLSDDVDEFNQSFAALTEKVVQDAVRTGAAIQQLGVFSNALTKLAAQRQLPGGIAAIKSELSMLFDSLQQMPLAPATIEAHGGGFTAMGTKAAALAGRAGVIATGETPNIRETLNHLARELQDFAEKVTLSVTALSSETSLAVAAAARMAETTRTVATGRPLPRDGLRGVIERGSATSQAQAKEW